jgi:cytidylate kinase
MLRIAIDGTASAGKGTIAREVARRLNISYIDTGAMYRSVALKALQKGIPWEDTEEIASLTRSLEFKFIWQDAILQILVNGEDISEAIRQENIGSAASIVSAIPDVRKALVIVQKEYSQKSSLVMDGRDIGTVVIPDAELKIFVDANLKERANRRWKEERSKGLDTSLERVLADLKERDFRDRTRSVSPLIQAEDAELLDTTSISVEEAVQQILSWVQETL